MGFRPQFRAKLCPVASGLVVGAGAQGALGGWSIRETGGINPVSVDIYDGVSTGGVLLASITVPAGGDRWAWFGGDDSGEGLDCDTSLFVNLTGTGVPKGSIFYAG